MKLIKCKICNAEMISKFIPEKDLFVFVCERCGRVRLADSEYIKKQFDGKNIKI